MSVLREMVRTHLADRDAASREPKGWTEENEGRYSALLVASQTLTHDTLYPLVAEYVSAVEAVRNEKTPSLSARMDAAGNALRAAVLS